MKKLNDNDVPCMNYYEEPIDEISFDEIVNDEPIRRYEQLLEICYHIAEDWFKLSAEEQQKYFDDYEDDTCDEPIYDFAYGKMNEYCSDVANNYDKIGSRMRLAISAIVCKMINLKEILK